MVNFSKWLEQGLACLKDEDYASSIYNFKKCLDINSNDSEVWYNIAIAYRKLERSEYAEPCMERSSNLNPKNKEAKELLEEISSEVFSQTMFGMYGKPIGIVQIRENEIKEKADALLDIFRPYLVLNNSSINILGMERENEGGNLRYKMRIELSGNLSGMGSMRLQADIQNSLENLDPSIRLVWVETHYI